MLLVLDANVLFAALLKDSGSRKLIGDRRLVLFAPEFLLVEFDKYSRELKERTGLSDDDFSELSARLVNRIKFVPDREIIPFMAAANHLTKDKKDVPYIACALAVNADIWSSDRHFDNKRVKVFSTRELLLAMY